MTGQPSGTTTDTPWNRAYKARWRELRRGPLRTENIVGQIDTWAAELREAGPRNTTRWPSQRPRFGDLQGEIDHLKDRVVALRSGRDEAVIDAIVQHGWLRPGTRIDLKRMVELARLSVLPLVDHRPFTYTRGYITETIDAMFNIDGPYGPVIRQMTLPRNQLMLTRIHLGLGGLFAKLGATADWASILDEYLFDAPPSTPMGVEVAGWPKVALSANRPPDSGRTGTTS